MSLGENSSGADRKNIYGPMVRGFIDRTGPWLLIFTCIPALTLLLSLVRIFASRLTFPMDLEWIEGGQLLHVHRLLRGEDIYVEPNQGFMPYSYPPGHTLLLGAISAIFGVDYWVGRLFSLAAMAGVMGLVTREVYREYRSVGLPFAWAILALGMICAAFPLTAGWFDLIRNDEIVLVLVLASAFLVLDERPMTRFRFVATVLLMNAAVYTKQTAAFYLVWILTFALFRSPRQGLKLGLALAAAGLASLLCLEWLTEGRYLNYTVWLLKEQTVHQHMYGQAIEKWLDFAPYLTLLPALALIGAWFQILSARAIFFLGLLAAAFPASILPYAKQGGYLNNLLPVAVLAGPTLLCVLGSFLRFAPYRSRFVEAIKLSLGVTLALYLQQRQFPTGPYTVTEEMRAKASRLTSRIRALGPSVLIPHHPFLAIKAGATVEQIHEMPWVDAWLAGVKDLSLHGFIDRVQPKYVVLSEMEIPLFVESIQKDYELYQVLPSTELVPPITGFPSHPKLIMTRKASAYDPKNPCLFDFDRSYKGWRARGTSFRSGPQSQLPRKVVVGKEGRSFASSQSGGDESTGKLESSAFLITKPHMSLLVGGSEHPGLRVELEVNGSVVKQVSGPGADAMHRVKWDLSEFVGQEAAVSIVDENPGGHILVDSICLAN